MKVFVAGHRGMVGGAIVRRLESESCEVLSATHAELDLTQQAEVNKWVKANKPDAESTTGVSDSEGMRLKLLV